MSEATQRTTPAPDAPPSAPAATSDASASTFALLGALTSATSIGASIVRSKVTAHVVGPDGLGTFSEVTQLVALATSASTVAAGPVLIAWVSAAQRDGDGEKLRRGMGTAATLGLLLTVLGGALSVALARWVIPDQNAALRTFTLLAAISTTCTVLAGVYQSGFVGTADLRSATLATLATTLLSGACVVGMTVAFGLNGLFAALAVGNALALAASLSLARRRGLAARPAWDRTFLRHAVALGATMLVSAVLSQVSASSIRASLAYAGGAARGATYNGNYQAASQIGTQYFAVILSGLSSYYFPRYATATTSAALAAEVYSAASFVLRLAPPVVIAAIALRAPLITLLYSHRFDLAVSILGFQLAGDIPKSIAWAYAGPLVFRGEFRGFLVTEVLGTVISIAASVGFVWWLGPTGSGLASTVTSSLYALITVAVLSRVCGVAPRWSLALRAIALAAACLALELLTRRWAALRWAALAASAVWIWRLGAVDYLSARIKRVLHKLKRR